MVQANHLQPPLDQLMRWHERVKLCTPVLAGLHKYGSIQQAIKSKKPGELYAQPGSSYRAELNPIQSQSLLKIAQSLLKQTLCNFMY